MGSGNYGVVNFAAEIIGTMTLWSRAQTVTCTDYVGQTAYSFRTVSLVGTESN